MACSDCSVIRAAMLPGSASSKPAVSVRTIVVPANADARFFAVARQAGHVVDKRKPFAREPVE